MPQFYDLGEETRIALTLDAISQRKTLMTRWESLDLQQTATWTDRAVKAAGQLRNCSSVVDLGCGVMTLEQHLDGNCRYIPVDVIQRDDRTIVADLNETPLPSIRADAVVGLGLLEYLHDVSALIEACAAQYAIAVFSYNLTDAPKAIDNRLAHAWVNNYSASSLSDIFLRHGLTIQVSEMIDERQMLWKLGNPRWPAPTGSDLV